MSSNGHTAGLGKGFLIVVAIIIGVIAVLGGIAFVIGALFKSTLLMVILSAACTAFGAKFFCQSRSEIAVVGASGGIAAFAASLVFKAITGFTGGLVGLIVFLIVFLVVLFCGVSRLPKKNK